MSGRGSTVVAGNAQVDYQFGSANAPCNIAYLEPIILAACKRHGVQSVFDLGCGNGALCRSLREHGLGVAGCDPSESGIAKARELMPNSDFRVLSVYDDPTELGGRQYDAVLSTEVIEHLFAPRCLPRFAAKILKPGGVLILSTPYHGYLKNFMLSLLNKWDFHHTSLCDGGHIKFWSRATATALLRSEGFEVVEFIGAGRFRYVWKSMVLIARRTAEVPRVQSRSGLSC